MNSTYDVYCILLTDDEAAINGSAIRICGSTEYKISLTVGFSVITVE